MKHAQKLSLLLILLCSAGAHAQQLYKWVGPDGKVTYSDVPPPPTIKQVEKKSASFGTAAASNLPFELAEAARSHPVTLYTSPQCAPCDSGRTLLNSRGIPFAEKTVTNNEDIAQLRQAGGDGQLPLLVIGRNKHKGFESVGWTASLTAAGYPETSKLPASYRNPAPEAAAPPPKTAASQAASGAQAPVTSIEDLPPASGNAPPGFRF
ncbi:MAG: glutaredoxin [Burkholderiales bacterium RIFCSPLOWO2_02_FULL_57_36]|nr:MAG: glutaredoxin [Burkholderiales bacterium RIFCSPLOWO2_02_FULL_57_36]